MWTVRSSFWSARIPGAPNGLWPASWACPPRRPGTVSLGSSASQRTIVEQIAGVPELEALDVVTGAIDMLARLRVRDHAHLRRLLGQIWEIEGVQRTETLLSLVGLEPKNVVAELLSKPAVEPA
jgi:hypothetical protein